MPIEAFTPKQATAGLQRGIETRANLALKNIGDLQPGETYFDENGVQVFYDPTATQGEISPAGKASPTDPGFFVSQRAEQQVEFADLSIVGHTGAAEATASGLPQITTVAGGTYQSQDAIVVDTEITIDGRALTAGTYYFSAATTTADVNNLLRLSASGTPGLHKGLATRATIAALDIADLQPGEMYVDENGILLVFDPNATSGLVAPQGKALPTDPGYFKAVSTATSDAASDWVASYSYTGTDNEVFSAVAVAGAIDINGQVLTTGTRYLLKYPTDQVSGLTLDVAEFAKMEVVGAASTPVTAEPWSTIGIANSPVTLTYGQHRFVDLASTSVGTRLSITVNAPAPTDTDGTLYLRALPGQSWAGGYLEIIANDGAGGQRQFQASEGPTTDASVLISDKPAGGAFIAFDSTTNTLQVVALRVEP